MRGRLPVACARMLLAAALLGALVVGIGGRALAHESGAVYLKIQVAKDSLRVDVEMSLRDALILLSLAPDSSDERAIFEVLARGEAFPRRIADAIHFRANERSCSLVSRSPAVARTAEPGVIRLSFLGRCTGAIERLSVHYGLLFDLDPKHRVFVATEAGSATHSVILGPANREAAFDLGPATALALLGPYLREGVHHVATGFDHLLFLAALLLPAALVRSGVRWAPRERARDVLVEVAFVVSAFTVAHSLTLCAAALNVVQPPRRWVESLIALTVLVAALNNVAPLLRVRPWQLAFGLGLVHGFGFAAQLGILGLPAAQRGAALLGFNVGVELGQLAVVAVCLPPLLALRRNRFYRTGVLEVPSLLIAWVAGVWLFERAFDIPLLG